MSENSDAKQRLLIVDDSKVIRVTARKILQGQYETVEAVDGKNAWEILSGMGPFSLVISDLTMPKLDGYGLLEKIRAAHDPDINSLPVIVITGDNDSESTMQRAREAGATDFIGKPFDAVHLLARVQSHAEAYAAHRSLTEQNMELEDQLQVDKQTGLANEIAFMERGKEQLSYAKRHNTTLTVAQIEIDNYGNLLQQHGDPVTEMVVKYVANVLQSDIRQEDMAARIGPARYAMLLTGMERNGVQALTSRISRDIRERIIRYGNEEIGFTASIGICAPAIEADTDFEDLLTIAGKNLQQAIAQHGNRTVFDNDPGTSVQPEGKAVTDKTSIEKGLEQVTSEVDTHTPGNEPLDTPGPVTDAEVAAIIEAAVIEEPATEDEADVTPAALSQTASKPETMTETTADTATEQLPEMFAEPVAGNSKKLATAQDEIVISAPFSAFNGTASERLQEQATTTDHKYSGQSAAGPETAIHEAASTQRKGFFSRIFSIFRRSGK